MWIREKLLDAIKANSRSNLFRVYRGAFYQVWIERHQNKNRSFITVLKNGGQNGVQRIIIPQGQIFEGWRKMAECLQNFHLGGREKGTFIKEGECADKRRTFTYRNHFNSYADCTRFGSWNRAVVCRRFSMADSWEAIEQRLESRFKAKFRIQPFQDDKAVFMCYNFTETDELGAMGFCKFEENLYVQLSKWVPSLNKRLDVLACNGGWVRICGLPFHMWRMDVFEKIGECCGGCIEVHNETIKMKDLREAKIKVRKPETGFIPAAISVLEGGTEVVVAMRVLLKEIESEGSTESWCTTRELKDERNRVRGKSREEQRWSFQSRRGRVSKLPTCYQISEVGAGIDKVRDIKCKLQPLVQNSKIQITEDLTQIIWAES